MLKIRRISMVTMKMTVMVIMTVVLSAGCGVWTVEEQKTGEIKYEIMKHTEIPEELKQEIQDAKKSEMWISYADTGNNGGNMYVVRGYGRQETTGYSIEINECYETENTIVVCTTLLGPQKKEKTHKKETYPYIVIEMPYTEKKIIYE